MINFIVDLGLFLFGGLELDILIYEIEKEDDLKLSILKKQKSIDLYDYNLENIKDVNCESIIINNDCVKN